MDVLAALLVFSASGIVTAVLALIIASQRRFAPMSRAFVGWLLAHSGWALSAVGEHLAETLPAKLIFDGAGWVFLPVMVGSAMTFTWRLMGSPRGASRWVGVISGLLMGGPVVGALVMQLAHRHRAGAWVGPMGELFYEFSPLDLLALGLMYGTLGYAVIKLWLTLRRRPRAERRPLLMAALALGGTMVIGLTALLDWRILGQRDTLSLLFGSAALVTFFGVYRQRFLEIGALGRDAVIDALPDPCLVFDAEERLVDANLAARVLVGEDCIGMSRAVLLPTGAPCVAGRQLVLREVPLKGLRGEPLGQAVVLRDVTQVEVWNRALEDQVELHSGALADAREALSERDAHLRVIFDATTSFLCLLDRERRVVLANRALMEISKNRIRSGERLDLLGMAENLEPMLTQAYAGRAAQDELVSSTGRVYAVGVAPALDLAGQVRWVLCEGREVTALREAEQARRLLIERLSRAERLESLGRLASGVAHDFNNLLQVMSTSLSVLRQGSRSEPLDELAQAVESATSLARQLLAFGRGRAAAPEVVTLDRNIQVLGRLLKRLATERVAVELKLGAKEAAVFIDPVHLEQMVMNLVVNAQQATEQGRITVETGREHLRVLPESAFGTLRFVGEYAFVRVRDTGRGMNPEVLAHAFEPFYTTKENGTGLGLASVYALVSGAEGLVTVDSVAGEGTSITCYFPHREGLSAQASCLPIQPTPSLKVLLVDDEALIRRVASRAIESLGSTVLAVGDAKSALAALAAEPFDVMVTDVLMPGVSGLELAAQVATLYPNMGLIFASGLAANEDLELWVQEGRAALVEKPFTLETMRRALLREASRIGRIDAAG